MVRLTGAVPIFRNSTNAERGIIIGQIYNFPFFFQNATCTEKKKMLHGIVIKNIFYDYKMLCLFAFTN